MNRFHLTLLSLVLASLACQTVLPNPTAIPTSTARPLPPTTTPLPASPTPTLAATPTPGAITRPQPTPFSTTPSGVRYCAYQPGVSIPAQMPPEVLQSPTHEPFPTSAPPQPSQVSADTTTHQLSVFEDLWQVVKDNYLYSDFNGHDWDAIGDQYRALIQGGLSDEDFYSAMDAMIFELGDEHSQYQSPQSVKEEEASFAGNNDYVGIGVLHTFLGDRSVIIFTFPDSPAREAGLLPHDSIVAVNGTPVANIENGISSVIRGPEGTEVTISVARPGAENFDLTLIRRRITGAAPIDYCLVPGPRRIAYIFLPGLDDATFPEQLRVALENMTMDGPLDGLVLDNRQNGGGGSDIFEESIGLFTHGTVGYFVNRQGKDPLRITAEDVGGSQTLPMVVLVGLDTVSFGEIMSGALQNSGRALVVGQTTLGNVEILYGYDFDDGSRAWVAHDTFQPVNLENGLWEKTGIVPDVSVPTRWDLFTEATDPALAKAVELLSQP